MCIKKCKQFTIVNDKKNVNNGKEMHIITNNVMIFGII